MAIARALVQSQKSRTHDGFGTGQYGGRRDGGARSHRGLDIVTKPQEKIFAPIDGDVVREAIPYAKYPAMKGMVIRGKAAWSGYEVKIFYVEGLFSGAVAAGQHIGYAQDISIKYPGITNHVHVEVRKNAVVINPGEIFAQCF